MIITILFFFNYWILFVKNYFVRNKFVNNYLLKIITLPSHPQGSCVSLSASSEPSTAHLAYEIENIVKEKMVGFD